ncbi:hypothetical protein Forpi1262_v017929 [Fusarium oxysporum f. sp. raphani]|uniref:Uncharacterized protein n=1 Tax=Fusarium oxysporum f. sp. raphani TaxID=96318 RepID=A0A8J5TS27_FUSOX|nr:hypothetical protein Forpi1262_v017929 [Fusarium oxysporum f. sp. raphani]
MMSLPDQHRLYLQIVCLKQTSWTDHCPYSQQILSCPEISMNRTPTTRSFLKHLQAIINSQVATSHLHQISSMIMACGCQRRITKTKWQNCTNTPKHEQEKVVLITCSEKEHTGYKDVYTGSTLVRAPGHICPKC